MQYQEEDLIREFEFEHKRTESYFDRMYRVLQFTFAAVIAIVIAAFQVESVEVKNVENYGAILLMLILPACTYVFGPMYAFNAYALAVGGARAEAIHEKIYEIKYGAIKDSDKSENQDNVDKVVRRYVLNDRHLSLLTYGVALGCFFIVPFFSILIGWTLFDSHAVWIHWVALVCLAVYLIIMFFILAGIIKTHFLTTKIQKKANLLLKK